MTRRRPALRTALGAALGRARAAAAVVAAALFLSAPAAADSVGRGYQVRDDDAARIAVGEFRRHASRNEWRAAAAQVQKLLDLPPERGVVIAVEGAQPPRYESAWRAAVRLFDGLPPEGRAAWEELARRPAEELVARGLRLRREEDLAAAARRYPARDVRRRAHDALAHLALARGDFGRSARELESLLECADPGDEPSVLARLAFCRGQEGDAEGAARVAQLAARFADAEVPGPRGRERLADFVERMRALAAASGRRFAGARHFGGDRHGTGVSEAPPQIAGPSWASPAPTDFAPGEEIEGAYRPVDERFRPVIPAVAQGMVYVNGGLSLTAYDVSTGRPAWRHDTPQTDRAWRDHPNVYHTATVADGVVYAALVTRSDAPDVERRFYGNLIIYSLPHRTLHAFDARTGDLLWSHDTPRLGGRADAAEIDRECVASPPLVVGDDVIALTWTFSTQYEARLACFDRRTGATRWRTSLVHGQQEMNLFGRPVKEVVVPPLAELDGVVFASTGFGVVAAVDRVTGGVQWLAEHGTSEIPPTYQWFETRDRDPTWRPSPISATRAAVVVAPVESEHLYAFDPRTGANVWQPKRQRTSAAAMWWFLGVMDGRAWALGSRVFCWDLATGRDAWTAPDAGRLARVGDTARPAAGRGLLTPGAVLVPTVAGIVRVDAATGAFVDVREIPRPAGEQRGRSRTDGDLTSADGALVVTTDRSVEAYFRFDDLARRLEDRIIASPDDPQLRLEAGEIHLASGRTDSGVEHLERALAAAAKLPGGAAARAEPAIRHALVGGLLVRARLRRSGTDGPGAWADLERAVAVAASPQDSVRALLAVADTAAETQRLDACEAALRRLARDFPDETVVTEDDSRAEAGALATVRLGQIAADRGDVAGAVETWLALLESRPDASVGPTNVTGAVRAGLDALVERHGERAAAAVDARTRRSLTAAVAAKDVTALHRIARTSPAAAVAADAALAAASLHGAAGRPREAAAVLEGLVLRPRTPRSVQARAMWALHLAYEEMRETPRERAVLRRIVQECPDEKLDDGRAAGVAARDVLGSERFRDAPASIPDPRPPLAMRWERLGGADAPAMQYVAVQGSRPRVLEGRLLFVQDRRLRLVDAATGDDRWVSPAGVEVRSAFGALDTVALVGEDAEIRPRIVRVDGIAAADGRRAWSKRLPGRYGHAVSSLGVVHVHRWETDERGDRVSWITSLAIESGDLVAERRLGTAIHPQITAAADAIVAWEIVVQGTSARRRALVLDAATLATRGASEIEGHSSPFSLPVPGTSLVATTSGQNGVAAVDVATGALAWAPWTQKGGAVKGLLVVPGGIVVSDVDDRIRRLDAATGREEWVRPLGGDGLSLGYNGEAAEGDLVAATLVASQGPASPVGVGIDARTGEVRWRTPLAADGRVLPRPEVLAGVVAWEMNVRLPGAEYACRVDLVSRADGRLAGSVSHPVIGRSMQRAFYVGPSILLWTPPRADLALFGAAAPSGK